MNEEQRLNTLLNSLPLEPLPAGLTTRIMREIGQMRAGNVARPTFTPFRLNLSDILLALALTVLMIVGLYAVAIPLFYNTQLLDFSQMQLSFDTNNLTVAFLFLLELLLGGAIYLSMVEE